VEAGQFRLVVTVETALRQVLQGHQSPVRVVVVRSDTRHIGPLVLVGQVGVVLAVLD